MRGVDRWCRMFFFFDWPCACCVFCLLPRVNRSSACVAVCSYACQLDGESAYCLLMCRMNGMSMPRPPSYHKTSFISRYLVMEEMCFGNLRYVECTFREESAKRLKTNMVVSWCHDDMLRIWKGFSSGKVAASLAKKWMPSQFMSAAHKQLWIKLNVYVYKCQLERYAHGFRFKLNPFKPHDLTKSQVNDDLTGYVSSRHMIQLCLFHNSQVLFAILPSS